MRWLLLALIFVASATFGQTNNFNILDGNPLRVTGLTLPNTGVISWGGSGKLTGILSGTAVQLNGELVASDSGSAGALALFGCSHVDDSRCWASDRPGDANNRFTILTGGTLQWGPGSTPTDTTLIRGGLGQILWTGTGASVLSQQTLTGGAGVQITTLNAGQTDYEQYYVLGNTVKLASRTGVNTAALVATFSAVPSNVNNFLFTGAASGGNPTIGTNAGNVGIAAPIALNAPITNAGTTYTVAATDNFLIANAAATQTLTLPTASANTGRTIRVKTTAAFTVVSASSNVVPLIGGSAATAILAATAGKWADLTSDGTNWVIMAGN